MLFVCSILKFTLCFCRPTRFSDVEVLSKFSQMEFKYGNSEIGKTMLESTLSNFPKRTDLGSVYTDMVTILGDLEPMR